MSKETDIGGGCLFALVLFIFFVLMYLGTRVAAIEKTLGIKPPTFVEWLKR